MMQYRKWLELMDIADDISKSSDSKENRDIAARIRDTAMASLIVAGFPYEILREGVVQVFTDDKAYIGRLNVSKPQASANQGKEPSGKGAASKKEPEKPQASIGFDVQPDNEKQIRKDTVQIEKGVLPGIGAAESESKREEKEEIKSAEDAPEKNAEEAKTEPLKVDGLEEIDTEEETRELKAQKVSEEKQEEPKTVAVNEPVKQEQKEEKQKEPPAAEPNQEESSKAGQPYMSKADLTFAYHQLTLQKNDSVWKMEVIAFPMSMREGENELCVWAQTPDRKHATKLSRGGNNTVILSAVSADVMITGNVRDGKFEDEIVLSKRSEATGYTMTQKTKVYQGTKGHVVQADDGIEVHIFPLSFKNAESGNAEFAYVIKRERGGKEAGDTVGRQGMSFDHDGNRYNVVARWQDSTIYSSIRQIGK